MKYSWIHGCGWAGLLGMDPVDLLLTDAPYDSYVYENSRRTRTGDEVFDLGHSPLTDAEIALACYAIAKRSKRWALIFIDVETHHVWRDLLIEYGMRYIGLGIWHKEPSTPQKTGDRGARNYEHYLIMHSTTCAPRWNGGGRGICFRHPPAPSFAGRHPTEKPVKMMEMLVRLYSNRGDTVADIFGGRATTLAAAIRCGRKPFGWEKLEEWHRKGEERLRDEREALQLLDDDQMLAWYDRPLTEGEGQPRLLTKEQMGPRVKKA